VSPLSPDTLDDVDDKPLDFMVLNRGTYFVERTGVNPAGAGMNDNIDHSCATSIPVDILQKVPFEL
jgi:hypothetical protein